MANHTLTLGQSISTAIASGAAGDNYIFASGIYYGQSFSPKAGDTYFGAVGGGTILSGAWLVTSWTNVSGTWYRATQGLSDNNGASQTNFPALINTLWRGTATISGTTITIVSTISGTYSAPAGGASLYGNGVAAGTVTVSGTTISPSQTVSSTTNMILVAQGFENASNGAAPNDPLAYLSEELFLDGARLTRIQAAGTPVAPGAGQWFYDYSNNSVNININPSGHTVEYSCTQCMCNMGTGANFNMSGLTFEKYAWFEQGAILCFPDGAVNLYNCIGRFNSGCAVNVNSNYLGVFGGSYTDNGANGIIGGPDRGFIIGAEIARNNPTARLVVGWQAGGLKFTGATNSIVVGCNVHDNGGPGIWNDVFSLRNIIGDNTCTNNAGPGIMDEISSAAKIFNNTISGSGAGAVDGYPRCGIYVSNSSNVEVYNNRITVGIGHTARIGGGIDVYNGARGSSTSQAAASFTGAVSGSTLTVTALTGTLITDATGQAMMLYGPHVLSGTFLLKQLTGSAGSTGTYQLSYTQPTISATAMLGVTENNNVLCEGRNVSVHHNTITYLDATGATDGFAADQAIVGGSNNYRDFNTYYTPNSSGTFWYHGTDAGVNTAYTWAAYQAAGFEPNSTNAVGVAPGTLPSASPTAGYRTMFGSVTLVALDVSTVSTGGTAVNALSAGHCTAGGRIQNPSTASTALGINQNGTASGTSSNGSTVFIQPGATYWLVASPNAVSVISSDSSHPFSGEGWQ